MTSDTAMSRLVDDCCARLLRGQRVGRLELVPSPLAEAGQLSMHSRLTNPALCKPRAPSQILAGERLYVHCWGGHGRTGTLIATMLGRLYCLPSNIALRYTQLFHDARRFPQGVRSPQTPMQVAQVRGMEPLNGRHRARPPRGPGLGARLRPPARPRGFPLSNHAIAPT